MTTQNKAPSRVPIAWANPENTTENIQKNTAKALLEDINKTLDEGKGVFSEGATTNIRALANSISEATTEVSAEKTIALQALKKKTMDDLRALQGQISYEKSLTNTSWLLRFVWVWQGNIKERQQQNRGAESDILMGYNETTGNYLITVQDFERKIELMGIAETNSKALSEYLYWACSFENKGKQKIANLFSKTYEGQQQAEKWLKIIGQDWALSVKLLGESRPDWASVSAEEVKKQTTEALREVMGIKKEAEEEFKKNNENTMETWFSQEQVHAMSNAYKLIQKSDIGSDALTIENICDILKKEPEKNKKIIKKIESNITLLNPEIRKKPIYSFSKKETNRFMHVAQQNDNHLLIYIVKGMDIRKEAKKTREEHYRKSWQETYKLDLKLLTTEQKEGYNKLCESIYSTAEQILRHPEWQTKEMQDEMKKKVEGQDDIDIVYGFLSERHRREEYFKSLEVKSQKEGKTPPEFIRILRDVRLEFDRIEHKEFKSIQEKMGSNTPDAVAKKVSDSEKYIRAEEERRVKEAEAQKQSNDKKTGETSEQGSTHKIGEKDFLKWFTEKLSPEIELNIITDNGKKQIEARISRTDHGSPAVLRFNMKTTVETIKDTISYVRAARLDFLGDNLWKVIRAWNKNSMHNEVEKIHVSDGIQEGASSVARAERNSLFTLAETLYLGETHRGESDEEREKRLSPQNLTNIQIQSRLTDTEVLKPDGALNLAGLEKVLKIKEPT